MMKTSSQGPTKSHLHSVTKILTGLSGALYLITVVSILNPLELFTYIFGAVRAVFWLCESFVAPDHHHVSTNVSSCNFPYAKPSKDVSSSSP